MYKFWQTLHRIGDILHLPELPNWLIGLLAIVLILRIPSFFEPYYYGDEMVYLTLGQGVRQGLTLYKDIHDNKPPLLYVTAAIAGSLFWLKAILAFWTLATIVFFYKLSAKMFSKNSAIQKIATSIFAFLTTLPLLEGNTVNSELFMIVFTIAAFLILLQDNLDNKKIYLAGLLFGIGALFKIPAAFDAPVIVFYWFLTLKNTNEVLLVLKRTLLLIGGFATPIILSIIWFAASGAFSEYLKAAFLQNIGYLSSFRPGDIQKPFLIRNEPLLVRAGIVFVTIIIMWFYRKKISRNFILLTIWTLFGLFAITLSERPYPHYFIQLVAPISLLLGMLFAEKNFEQVLVIIPIAISLFVPVYYKFYFYPTTNYYLRFINFAFNKIDKKTYFSEFSTNTNRNYEIANFLVMSSTPKDRVFMWDSDSAAVYALARRLPPIKYVVPYHVMSYSSNEEVAKIISQNPPKFIILTAGNPFPELSDLIRARYLLVDQIGNANIYSLVNLAP